jgi:hypothetical protein
MPRRTKADRERAERCRHPGCEARWITTFSPIGPVCFKHKPQANPHQTQQVPTTPAAKPWSEPDKDSDAEEV